ncbi:hypothetical protein BDW72DRAFT_205659 [Aspergillus terricola var. indicus]
MVGAISVGLLGNNKLINVEPPTVIGPATKKATRPSASSRKREALDPSVHLNFQTPKTICTMEQIGLRELGCSTRRFLLSASIHDPWRESGHSPNSYRPGPFIYDIWKCPEVIARISEVADIDLVPFIDLNCQHQRLNWSREHEFKLRTRQTNKPLPFVCLTVLSDCTGMVGGETALKTPIGEIRKIRGPVMGTAAVLQGRYNEHQAHKALGGRERISMVNCFLPSIPLIKDETMLVGARGISGLDALYIVKRIRHRLRKERERRAAKRPLDVKGSRRFLTGQVRFSEPKVEEISEVK